LAMPNSLSAALLPAESGMLIIMAEDLAMLSPVQAIMAAEAGVKAKVESMAAAISILISDLIWKGNRRIAGYRGTYSPPNTFPEEDNILF
jgi:hypothetical protein